MTNTQGDAHAELLSGPDGVRLQLRGDWTIGHYQRIRARIDVLRHQLEPEVQIDLSMLQALDTAGVSLLHALLGAERLQQLATDTSLPPARRALMQAVAPLVDGLPATAGASRYHYVFGDLLERIGRGTVSFWRHAVDMAAFIGITLEGLVRIMLHPRRWRLTALAANLEQTAFDAVPIVALLSFLVGAVVAFLGATVLAGFGASIFTVNLIAFSFLREFGVLLTAILVAGRTASAFTAQIGSMKANEEIDAMRVGGFNPIELLVLPRVLALLLALPMLTFVAIMAGLAGGMLVCMVKLDISATMFLSVMENAVGVRHFFVGMAKAPIFAFLIAVIGCLEGFKVAGSARSVGEHTTSAVVQSIFVVIVVDAIAALFCMEMGW